MKIGVVVDAGCVLPEDYVRKHNVTILPIAVRVEGREFIDRRDAAGSSDFLMQAGDLLSQAETAPLSVEQIERLFLQRLVIDHDYVLCLTIASSRSPIYEHATQASLSILSRYKPIRADAGVTGPFALRVIDTQTLFTGQAVLAVEAVRMIEAGVGPNAIRKRLEELIPNTYGYLLPNSLYHLRARAAKKGDKSVGWVKYMLGSALDIKPVLVANRNESKPVGSLRHFEQGSAKMFQFAIERIRAGLLTPTVLLGYTGDLAEMRRLPGYDKFLGVARDAGVEVIESPGGITATINLGPGGLLLGFSAPQHEFTG